MMPSIDAVSVISTEWFVGLARLRSDVELFEACSGADFVAVFF